MTTSSEDVKRILERVSEAELKEIVRGAIKEAIQDWLKDVFARFGRWSLAALGAVLISALLYFAAWLAGWRPH